MPTLQKYLRDTWPYLFLAITVALFFYPVCGHDFLLYDDAFNISDNKYVTNFSITNLLYFWKAPYEKLYIPLVYNFWTLLAWLSKIFQGGSAPLLNPHLFHTANLLLHMANTVVISLILKKLFRNTPAAVAGALLFALHPVQVEAVAWATGAKDLLSGFFSLLAIWQYTAYGDINGARKGGLAHYLLGILFFVCALLSKPGAVSVPLVAGLVACLAQDRSWRRVAPELVPYVLMALPVFIITMSAQPASEHLFSPNFWQRFLLAGDTIYFYLYKLALPLNLGPDYGRTPGFVLDHWQVWLSGLFPYVLAGLIYWKGSRPWRLSSAVFVAALLPVLGFVSFTFQNTSTVADRYLYFAMLGPSMALTSLLCRYPGTPVKTITTATLVLLGGMSFMQSRYWQNSTTFIAHALKINDNSYIAYNNLGNLKADQNRPAEAITAYLKAMAIDPGAPRPAFNLGLVYGRLKMNEKAITHYKMAIERNPGFAEAYSNLGLVYKDLMSYPEAQTAFAKAISLKPDLIEAYNNLGLLYAETGRKHQAIPFYEKAIDLDSTSPLPYNNLAKVYADTNREKEATEILEKAIKARPDYAPSYNNLSVFFFRMGKYSQAIRYADMAAELGSLDPKHRMVLDQYRKER